MSSVFAVLAAAAALAVPFSSTEQGAADRANLAADLAAAPAPKQVALPPMPAGPYQETWASIKANYKAPEWFVDAKFGLCMHWGLFSVPARQSEWYVRYMYGNNPGIMRDHIAKWGPLDQFGYKNFIPLFTAKIGIPPRGPLSSENPAPGSFLPPASITTDSPFGTAPTISLIR